MKIRPLGSESFHKDRQKDKQTKKHDETNNRFSQFCERA